MKNYPDEPRMSAKTLRQIEIGWHQAKHRRTVRWHRGAANFGYLKPLCKPKPAKPMQERPKEKRFVFGRRPYNPQITEFRVKSLREGAGEYTRWLNVSVEQEDPGDLYTPRLITMRARLLRFAREMERKLVRK